jgi:hypothetical protein
VVLAQMAKGNIITEKKEKRDFKVYQLLLILNWKAIEKDQQLISESLRDYMKKWFENKKPTDLIMTSTKMD